MKTLLISLLVLFITSELLGKTSGREIKLPNVTSSGILNADLTFSDLDVINENGRASRRVLYGSKSSFLMLVTNTTNEQRFLQASYEIIVPALQGETIRKTENVDYIFIDRNSSQDIGFKFSFPFNIDCSAISVHTIIRDKYTKQVLKEFTAEFPVERFLLSPVSITTNPRTSVVLSYYSLENAKGFKSALVKLLAESDTIASGWQAIFMASGRAGILQDEEVAENLYAAFIKKYERPSRKGDAELVYLIGMAKLLSRDPTISAFGEFLLRKAAEAKYKPAMYDYAIVQLTLNRPQEKQQALETLTELYNQGLKRSAIALANAYTSDTKDKSKARAFDWYQKVMNNTDGELYESLAKYYIVFSESDADIAKAESYADLAAKSGITGGMAYVGINLVTKDKSNDSQIERGLKLINSAASQGSREAMYTLGALQLSDKIIGPKRKDVISGLKWLKMAAEKGHSKAMKLLGYCYSDGSGGEINQIKSRYWLTKANVLGEKADKDVKALEPFSMNNLFSNLDFSPRREIIVTDGYGNEVQRYTEGPGPLELAFDGIIDTWKQSKLQRQPFINGIEFIQTKNGYDIYAGTVSSQATTGLHVSQGQILEFVVTGAINFGAFAGTRGAGGNAVSGLATTGLGQDIQKISGNMAAYNISPNIPHGAFMIKIGSEDWKFIGHKQKFIADKSGDISIAVNDKDFTGNTGYFDFEIKTQSVAVKN